VVFKRYLATVPPGSRRIAEGHWKYRLSEFDALALDELTRERMTLWERAMEARGFASKTRRGAYDVLASAMRLAIDGGIIDGLPWGDVPRSHGGSGYRPARAVAKTRGCAATVEQVTALIMAARSIDIKLAEKYRYVGTAAKVTFLALTGLRQAEACAVGWQDVEIDTEPFVLRVHRQAGAQWQKRSEKLEPDAPTKTRTNRTQVLHINVVLALRAHRAELQRRGWYRANGPVFPGDSGEWRTSGRVLKPERVREIAAMAGCRDADAWVTHSFRHSFATLEVIASGGDLRRTQARTGHASLAQLEGYMHAAGGSLGRSAVPQLPLAEPQIVQPMTGIGGGNEIVRMVDLDPWGIEQAFAPPDISEADLDKARLIEGIRAAEKRTLRAGSERSFRELAAEWLTREGDAGIRGRPEEVSEAEKRAYCRAYMAAKRAKCTAEECKKAGKRARIATEAAWRRQVTAAINAAKSLIVESGKTKDNAEEI